MADVNESTPLIDGGNEEGRRNSTSPTTSPGRSSAQAAQARSVHFSPSTTSLTSAARRDAPNPSRTKSAPAAGLPPPVTATRSHQSTTALPGTPQIINAINNTLRRRGSSGNPALPLPGTLAATGPAVVQPKIGPQRTTKTAQKLKILPTPDDAVEPAVAIDDTADDDEDQDDIKDPSKRDVYSQFARISDPISRRDAARLGKADRERLPRVTAYAVAEAYRLDDLMRHFKRRGKSVKRFDECLYCPWRKVDMSDSASSKKAADSNFEAGFGNNNDSSEGLDTNISVPEVFIFQYGTLVLWGMTAEAENRVIAQISQFATSPIEKDDFQVEEFNFYYTSEYQARIYNDFIALRSHQGGHMIKLAMSHALAQSVKMSVFEEATTATIAETQDIPRRIAADEKVALTNRELNMQMGALFSLRIDMHLQGSILDAPELMWAEPQLDPVYQAMRAYLEIDARVTVLNTRLDVIGDLLSVLKSQLTNAHAEGLEWVVIALIAVEIVVAAVNVGVDLFAVGS